GLDLLLPGHVPDLDGAVGAGGGELLTVRAEGYAVDRLGVRGAQVLDLLAVGGVPQADRLVLAAGGQQLAVLAEGDGIDDAGVALDFAALLAVGDVPQADGGVA